MSRVMLTVYDNGVPRSPTAAERKLPTSEAAPYRGCPTFVVVRGEKHWCQAGLRSDHEGTHCG